MKRALIQLHIAVFLWGFTAVLGRLITLNEGLLVWWRMALTVVSLWALLLYQRRVERFGLVPLFRAFGVGCLVVLHWVFFYGSIKYANASIALVCLSSSGLFTSLLEPLFFRRRVSFQEIALGLLCMSGIYCIFQFDPHFKTGIILGVIAALLSCLFTLANKRLVTDHTSDNVTLYELTGGFLFWSLALPVYLHFFPEPSFFPGWANFGWLLLLSWLCTVLAFTLSLHALRKITPFTLTLTYNLEPVYGIILAFLVYHENRYLGGGFYIGFGLIILSVTLQMLRLLRAGRRTPAGIAS
ncbi:DMT family transporter [Dinghuibacter silviterrae]|uniref:EamA-like transporter family protein n=1 Tax=Dinghuibacter silviterrae TaxID=1539049 RepID=A0A4R8DFT3_9BACT|nr:DMT family transporter [Dinghuibacter silviterrae]TDW96469.1 EamA-like transporter family protein [Dinghuibacter silviterrae]